MEPPPSRSRGGPAGHVPRSPGARIPRKEPSMSVSETTVPVAGSDGPTNVVVVLLDSLNRHMLGCYGGTEFETPNLDRFADRATRFDNHVAGSLPCMPARHDILCGAIDFLWKPWGSVELWEHPITWHLRQQHVTTMLVSDHPHLFETGGENYHTDFFSWEYLRGHENDPWKSYLDPTWVGAPARPARQPPPASQPPPAPQPPPPRPLPQALQLLTERSAAAASPLRRTASRSAAPRPAPARPAGTGPRRTGAGTRAPRHGPGAGARHDAWRRKTPARPPRPCEGPRPAAPRAGRGCGTGSRRSP